MRVILSAAKDDMFWRVFYGMHAMKKVLWRMVPEVKECGQKA